MWAAIEHVESETLAALAAMMNHRGLNPLPSITPSPPPCFPRLPSRFEPEQRSLARCSRYPDAARAEARGGSGSQARSHGAGLAVRRWQGWNGPAVHAFRPLRGRAVLPAPPARPADLLCAQAHTHTEVELRAFNPPLAPAQKRQEKRARQPSSEASGSLASTTSDVCRQPSLSQLPTRPRPIHNGWAGLGPSLPRCSPSNWPSLLVESGTADWMHICTSCIQTHDVSRSRSKLKSSPFPRAQTSMQGMRLSFSFCFARSSSP